jgi:photosystem II stability/assembly factor-like uncharacterized protein
MSMLPASTEWRVTGPYGGDAELVRVVPKTPGFVLAGAHNGLLFSSSNGGASWSNVPFAGQLTGVLHALEVDPRSKGTWYAGMEGDRTWTSGVYKTVDAGQTWKLLPGTSGKAVWSLALWPGNPDMIAAGTGDGIFRSSDAGGAWARISPLDNEELRPVVSLAFDPVQSDILYAGTTHLPWRTTDGGKSWNSIHTGMIDDSDVFSIQVDTHQPESVYASACSGLYQSSDKAGHWTKLPTPKGAFRTWFVALDPRHKGSVFAGTTEGLLHSDDGGKIWRIVTSEAVRSVAFDPSTEGRLFFASTTGGMMVSTDGGRTLHESNYGFTNRSFTMLAGARGLMYATSVFSAGSNGVYRTDNLGLRWQQAGAEAQGREIRLLTAAPDQPATVYAANFHGLMKSTDGGKAWTEKQALPPGGRITGILALEHDTLLVATAAGLYRSTNGGNWAPSGIPGNVASIQPTGDHLVTALTAQQAFASGDAGVRWKTCGSPAPDAIWYGLAFDRGATLGTPSQTALAATSAGLFRSTNGCESWTKVAGGLSAATVSIVLFHPTRTGEAYASQDGRIFHSTNGGQTWLAIDEAEDDKTWPSALLVLPEAPDHLFALLPRRGVALRRVD